METTQQTKICNKCGASKPISEFYYVSKTSGTRRKTCKECSYQKISTFTISVTGSDGSTKAFNKISSYEFSDGFFRIEDGEEINFFRLDSVDRIVIRKADASKPESKTPQIKIATGMV